MKIRQFEDKYLAHYSYAILSESNREIVLIDPSRNPQPYLDYAEEQQAKIIGVIETHPHADFVSSHLEFHQQLGASIYSSKLIDAEYPRQNFDEGDTIAFGEMKLKALNTPGHSPDSICVLLEHEGENKAVFTGDTLFIGDCGRPDLRESSGSAHEERKVLAGQMYHSLRQKLMTLANDVIVYPAHGAGTLCGKSLSDANSSTIGNERLQNWSVQEMDEATFVKELTEDQPFIPKYFAYNVALNKQGAANFEEAISNIPLRDSVADLEEGVLIVDSRDKGAFRQGHFAKAINLMEGNKFETWLGSIVSPDEKFVLVARDESSARQLVERAAAIGYEKHLSAAYFDVKGEEAFTNGNLDDFRESPESYTIVDVRNAKEVKERKIFGKSITIPLGELRERMHEIPQDKPIAIHCAAGYRSAAATSIISAAFPDKPILDIGESIQNF